MEEKIRARIEQIKKEREQVMAGLQREVNMTLAPYNAAIAELEALLEPEQEGAEAASTDG